jgi:alanine racemase
MKETSPVRRTEKRGVEIIYTKFQKDRAWLEICLDNIEYNYHFLRKTLKANCEIMAVLKGDAYGLGAVTIGSMLEKIGCQYFCVACMSEAMELREAGIEAPILLLSPIEPNLTSVAIENGIEVPVVSLNQGKALSSMAEILGKRLRVHIKADTGLSRFGILVPGRIEEAVNEAAVISTLPGLSAIGVFSHFSTIQAVEGDEFNRKQIDLFNLFSDKLKEKGHDLKRHCSSSIFSQLYPETHNDYVRLGALLLGIQGPLRKGFQCKQSTEFKARIQQIKEVSAGVSVSYGQTYYTFRRTRIAIVSVGFADGLQRSISNNASVLVKGKPAQIIGKLAMDYTMLDVTDIPEAKEWDTVTIFGNDQGTELPVWQLAEKFPGNPGELTSLIPHRVPRFYSRGGKTIGHWNK